MRSGLMAALGLMCMLGAGLPGGGGLASPALASVPALESGASAPYIEAFDRARPLLPRGARVAVILRDEQGRTLMSRFPDKLIAPASTLKLLTGVAAEQTLGHDFRFTTALYADGKDRVIRFVGDPFFKRSDLRQLLLSLKQGKSTIAGDLILDGDLFEGHSWSMAQSWNDTTICFAAPASAISLNHNCVQGNASTGDLNEPVRVYIPEHEPIQIVNETEVLKVATVKHRQCELNLKHRVANVYELTGCSYQRRDPMPLSIAVNDPVAYTVDILREELKTLGIKLKGRIRVGGVSFTEDARVLASHQSPPLSEMLIELMQESDNQLADVLLKTMGQRFVSEEGQQWPGNYRNGVAAMRDVLSEKLGISMGQAAISDGSGLSRHNLMSARTLADVLAWAVKQDESHVIASMPVSGESGSLKYRRGLINRPLKGRVQAKTGSLRGVVNLVGLLHTRSGEKLQFVVLIDGYSLSPEEWKAIRDRRGKRPLAEFYESLFEAWYGIDRS